MGMIDFIGKCLLIDKKLLVIGDLHLGYGESLRRSGIYLPGNLYSAIEKDLLEIFVRIGKVDKIILLGDVKHAIGNILEQERNHFARLFELLSGRCSEIIVIKGNHDALLEPILRDYSTKLVSFYIWERYAFIHGDRDFDEIYDKKIMTWVMGHAHPAVNLSDGIKTENYKCFLTGKYKGKEIVIMPSFFPFTEGSDPRDLGIGMPWNFNFNQFKVKIVGEKLEVLDFGKLKSIS
ncbi:MAG: metallophosphoesterase [Nanoarchaeota archaeon]